VKPESLSSRRTGFYTKRLSLLASQEQEENSCEIFATMQSIPLLQQHHWWCSQRNGCHNLRHHTRNSTNISRCPF